MSRREEAKALSWKGTNRVKPGGQGEIRSVGREKDEQREEERAERASTTSNATKFKPRRPCRIRLTSRVVQPPDSGVPAGEERRRKGQEGSASASGTGLRGWRARNASKLTRRLQTRGGNAQSAPALSRSEREVSRAFDSPLLRDQSRQYRGRA